MGHLTSYFLPTLLNSCLHFKKELFFAHWIFWKLPSKLNVWLFLLDAVVLNKVLKTTLEKSSTGHTKLQNTSDCFDTLIQATDLFQSEVAI